MLLMLIGSKRKQDQKFFSFGRVLLIRSNRWDQKWIWSASRRLACEILPAKRYYRRIIFVFPHAFSSHNMVRRETNEDFINKYLGVLRSSSKQAAIITPTPYLSSHFGHVCAGRFRHISFIPNSKLSKNATLFLWFPSTSGLSLEALTDVASLQGGVARSLSVYLRLFAFLLEMLVYKLLKSHH